MRAAGAGLAAETSAVVMRARREARAPRTPRAGSTGGASSAIGAGRWRSATAAGGDDTADLSEAGHNLLVRNDGAEPERGDAATAHVNLGYVLCRIGQPLEYLCHGATHAVKRSDS